MSEKQAAEKVMGTLREAGFEAYFVGGCVRDLLLGVHDPHDFDVTTNATPDQIAPLFEKILPIGAAFGVVVVMMDGFQIEVATFRADGDYSDGRRPDTVQYSLTAKEDVERRDFTMNGLLAFPDDDERDYAVTHPGAHYTLERVNPEPDNFDLTAIIDYVGGCSDIQKKLIRCIGDPVKRFTEDALRKMRAVRFAAKLGFDIEPETFKAICDNPSLANVSRERITEELFKLLLSSDPVKGLVPLMTTGLFREIFGDTAGFFRMQDTLMRFSRFRPATEEEALAMLLVDCDGVKTNANAVANLLTLIFAKLRVPSSVKNRVVAAITHQLSIQYADVYSRSFAIRMARTPGVLHLGTKVFEQSLTLGMMEEIGKPVDRLLSFTNAEIKPKLLLTGLDLIEAGYQPCPMFSRVLNEVEDAQLDGHVTTKEEALAMANDLIKEG